MKPLLIGNWKAGVTSLAEALQIVTNTEKFLKSSSADLDYYVACNDVLLTSLTKKFPERFFGIQNFDTTTAKQETGITLLPLLLSCGASFVILGHSEVRNRGESSNDVLIKYRELLSQNILSIICVGEIMRDAELKYEEVLLREIKRFVDETQERSYDKLVFAYEPVWAIGKESGMDCVTLYETLTMIRRFLVELIGFKNAKKIKIIYGGSVNSSSARNYIVEGGADGLLVGRSSQEGKEFGTLIRNAYGLQ